MQARLARFKASGIKAPAHAGPASLETTILSHRGGSTIIVQSNLGMRKEKSTRFNPKKEVSVMAWIARLTFHGSKIIKGQIRISWPLVF
jgi:hypothetical protein